MAVPNKIVVFSVMHSFKGPTYNPGDRAGFSAEDAELLVKKGVATYAESHVEALTTAHQMAKQESIAAEVTVASHQKALGEKSPLTLEAKGRAAEAQDVARVAEKELAEAIAAETKAEPAQPVESK